MKIVTSSRCALAGLLVLSLTASPAAAGDALVTSFNTNAVLRFDGGTGTYVSDFVAAGVGGLSAPHSARFGPDGNLYVSSFGNDRVLRYDGQTGAFLDAFVPPGSGGLDGPTDALFGPDGQLYVTSFFTPAVLKYDGVSGAFLGVFIGPGNGLFTAESGGFGPDGDFYLANGNGNNVLLYDGQTGAFQRIFASGQGLLDPHAVLFTPSGSVLVSAFGNQRVNEYAAGTGNFVRQLIGAANNLQNPHSMALYKGALFVPAFGRDKVNEYDPATGVFTRRFIAPGAGGLDGPISITFMPDPAQALAYGSGVNPDQSLVVLNGAPSIGTSMSFGIDNPLGTQAMGSTPLLAFSFLPHPAFPAGTLIPGLGMGAPGSAGELLLQLGFARFLTLTGAAWAGPGVPVAIGLDLPADVGFLGLRFYAQGLLIDTNVGAGVPLGLTGALELVVGF